MRILKQSTRKQPRLSLILLDWGVRESIHLVHYLKNQTVSRESFEVVVIEYYDNVSLAVKQFEQEVDTWVLLEMPAECYYHKHLMYNAGIVFGKGEILMFGDSDAMARPTFVETIFKAFDRDPLIVYHMDEFRNVRRDFYPFNYPPIEEVVGDGCINNIGGKTKGVLDVIDPVHTRNYGACMCARREDIIAIGGADEDMTYLGHICGPYDMTFRLMNFGRRLLWETEEYLYHTWHPGSDGIDNYLGPHDGKNMSTTAFHALCSGRIPPLVENAAILQLRTGSLADGPGSELASLIDPGYAEEFSRSKLRGPTGMSVAADGSYASHRGFDVFHIEGSFYAVPQQLGPVDLNSTEWRGGDRIIRGNSFTEVCATIEAFEAQFLETVGRCNICRVGQKFAVVPQELGSIDFRIRTHRENPRIAWVDSLREARRKATAVNATARRGAERSWDGTKAPDQPVPPVAFWDSSQARSSWELANLESRLAAVEVGVSRIYQSLTWRALTKVGGVLASAARLVKPGQIRQHKDRLAEAANRQH